MEVMKYIIPTILCAFFVGTFALAQGTGTINQLDQWRRTAVGEITQNIANSTIKLTGYESSGYCLVTDTDGVVSVSPCGTGGGGGASSTIIKINGTVSNTGVPTLDFGSGITVSESPTDEFNLSVPIYLGTSSSFTTGQVAFGTGPGAVGSIATGTLTETVTGLELSATRALLGGSAALSLTAGYEIPLSASTTQWLQAYASTTALTNSYIRGLFSASSPITYNSATGAFTFSTAGDWTGTFDGIEGSAYLARANHTGTQLSSTISDFTAAVQALSLGTSSAPTTGQVAFFTGARTLASAATGTLTDTVTGLSFSSQARSLIGGSAVLALDTGYSIPTTNSLLTANSSTTGNLAFWSGNQTIGNVATGTLTETVTGLELSATRSLVGGSAVLSLTSGYVVPTSTLWSNVSDFYTTPSTRITAGTGLSWAGNTLNATGGGGVYLATTTTWTVGNLARVASDGAVDSVATSSLGLLAPANIDTSTELAAILGDETGTGSVAFSTSPTFSGTAIFSSLRSTASTTIGGGTAASGLTIAGNATTTGTSTVGGLSIGSLTGILKSVAGAVVTALVNLATDVTGILPIANGGTGTSTATLLYKPSAIQVTSGASAITTGDGKAYFRIPKEYNGMNLVDVDITITSSSTSGYVEVQLARGRQSSATSSHSFSDMLSTRVTIDQGEFDSQYSATTTAINTSNDDVVEGDLIRIDVDRVGSGPSAVLIVQPVFGLP